MSTRNLRRPNLSGFERLEERRVLTAGTFLGQGIEMPSWISDEDIAQAQEELGGITFTDSDLPVFAYGDDVAEVHDKFAELNGGSQSRFAGLDKMLRAVVDLFDSLPEEKIVDIREFAQKLTTRPVDEQPPMKDRTANMLGKDFQIPDWVPEDRMEHLRELIGNVTDDADILDMQFHTTGDTAVMLGREVNIPDGIPEDRIEHLRELIENVTDDAMDMHFRTTDEPKTIDPIAGDSNGDGRFDSHDVDLVLQASEYQDDVEGNSRFEEGDWNGDGDFTREDIVFALQAGNYMP